MRISSKRLSTSLKTGLSLALLLTLDVGAHPRGTHKRLWINVKARGVEALVTLDVDSGRRAQGLRAVSDADHDGRLSKTELSDLRSRLSNLARRPLGVSVAGHSVDLGTVGVKLDLHGDRTAGEEGLSVAVLLSGTTPGEIASGMTLEVEDAALDGSPVAVEVQDERTVEGGAIPPIRSDTMLRGQKVRVNLR